MKTQTCMLALCIAVAALTACKRDCDGFPGCAVDVKFTDDSWRISGEVVDADTGQALPYQVIKIIQFERRPDWCSFCTIHGRNFYLVTDDKGRYDFSGQLPGQYNVIANPHEKGGYCSKSIAFGEIGDQKLHSRLALKHGPCPIIM